MSYAVSAYNASPYLLAGRFGSVFGSNAKHVSMLGSRSQGWTGTSVLGDACDYLDTTQALMNTPTAGQTLYIVSTSAGDDSDGAGAKTVRIVYLDAAGEQQVMTATMNGTSPVSLGSGFTFIQWMEVASLGTSEVSLGDIAVSSTNGVATVATTFCLIRAGGNRSLDGRYKVPTGYTAYLSHWGAAAVGLASMDVRLRATVFADDNSLSTVYHFQDRILLSIGSSGQFLKNFEPMPAGTVIKVSATPSAVAAGNRLDCDFHLLLVEE